MLSTVTLLADRGRYGDHDGPGFLLFLLFLLLVGFGTFAIIRSVRRRRGTWPEPGLGGSAKRVLDERFARGEIDRAEYEHRKAVLDGADVIPPAPATPPPPTSPAGGTATVAPPAPTAEHAPPTETSDPGDEPDGETNGDGAPGR